MQTCAVNEGIVAGPVGIIGLNTLEYPIVETNERPQRNLSFVIGPMSRDHFRPGCCNSDPANWLTFIWPRVGIIGSRFHTWIVVRVMHRVEEIRRLEVDQVRTIGKENCFFLFLKFRGINENSLSQHFYLSLRRIYAFTREKFMI